MALASVSWASVRLERASLQPWQGVVIGNINAVTSHHSTLVIQYERQPDQTVFHKTDGKTILIDEQSFAFGQSVICKLKLRSFRRKRNVDGMDELIWAITNGYYARGIVDQCAVVDDNTSHTFLKPNSLLRLRVALSETIGVATQSQRVEQALLLGNKHQLDVDTKTLFKTTGVYHLLVVSGLHLAMVGTLVYFLTICLLSGHRNLLVKVNRRHIALIVSTIAIAAFTAIVGLTPPTIRAFLFVLLTLVVICTHHRIDGMQLLVATVTVMLLWEPLLLFSVSFQLTVSATFGIIYGLQHRAVKCRDRSLLICWLKTLLLVNLMAFLFTLPVLALHFGHVSFLGLVTNLFYAPIVGYCILPFGLAGLFFQTISLSLGNTLLGISQEFIVSIINQLSCWRELLKPLSEVRPGQVPGSSIILWYALVLTVCHSTFTFTNYRLVRNTIILTLSLLTSYLLLPHSSSRFADVMDVGNGQAVLLQITQKYLKKHNILIDVGSKRYCSRVVERLYRRRVRTIDAIYISHWDEDHAGCLDTILSHYKVSALYSSYSSLKNYSIPVTIVYQSTRHRYGDLVVSVIYPDDKQLPRTANDRSLVLYVKYDQKASKQEIHMLFPGDIESLVEAEVVLTAKTKAVKTPISLLIAPHHGSPTSSSNEFVEHFAAQQVVISRQKDLDTEVVQRYRQFAKSVHWTGAAGDLLLFRDNEGLKIAGYACDQDAKPYNGWGSCR